MQDSISGPFIFNKGEMCSGQYDMPPPHYGWMWDQLHEQVKTKQQLKQITKSEKSEKSKTLIRKTELIESYRIVQIKPFEKTQKIK